jgi:hypothetical protein
MAEAMCDQYDLETTTFLIRGSDPLAPDAGSAVIRDHWSGA